MGWFGGVLPPLFLVQHLNHESLNAPFLSSECLNIWVDDDDLGGWFAKVKTPCSSLVVWSMRPGQRKKHQRQGEFQSPIFFKTGPGRFVQISFFKGFVYSKIFKKLEIWWFVIGVFRSFFLIHSGNFPNQSWRIWLSGVCLKSRVGSFFLNGSNNPSNQKNKNSRLPLKTDKKIVPWKKRVLIFGRHSIPFPYLSFGGSLKVANQRIPF